MSHLANQLVTAEREEIARGIRQLLATPLITERAAPEVFDLVRRRREPIRKWFDYYCGWTLTVEPRLGYARLLKVRAGTDSTRPARRPGPAGVPFDRRRYVLFCVVAAELLTVPVTTVGLLADRVARATAADDVVVTFDPASRAERAAFADVLGVLEGYGALEVVDGSTESFADSASAKVLYRVDSTLLLRLLAAPVGPSGLGVPPDEVASRFSELVSAVASERRYGLTSGRHQDSAAASETQRNLWLRHSVFRRLVDDPVLYFADLSAAEREYLTSPAGRQLLRRAAEQGGFALEERAEGVLLVDVDGIATDTRFPDDNSDTGVAALLLLDHLDGPATVEQLRNATAGLLRRFPRWAAACRDAGADRLTAGALAVLTAFDLVRITDGVVRPCPAAARYAVRGTEENPV
ncbi:TIGR02678 family protein [Amycolatopsis suaedae]|uniref:TIGR02678 family protein n=1 Tax=Amycolatopsis suaedae TaxID=2510978 RepID=A0A4Q7J817_9PSEU|nr:TIGR02678 family protein [Amycolatopsis suaedae]RZQ63347.1 TIGR02678 family protein [Amycolatopsis suaedae]